MKQLGATKEAMEAITPKYPYEYWVKRLSK